MPDVEKEKLVPGRESDVNNLDKGTPKNEPLLTNKEDKKGDDEKEETGEE